MLNPRAPAEKPVSLQETMEEFCKGPLDTKHYAIILIDTAGHVASLNPDASHIFHYKPEEIIGKSIACLYGKAENENTFVSTFLKTAASEGRREEKGWMYPKTGAPLFANSTLVPLYKEAAVPNGFTLLIQGITHQKSLAEENRILHDHLEEKVRQRTKELEVVNKELEAFSYSVSHDLRTPLRAISGYSNILKEDCSGLLDAEGNRVVDAILANTKMMGELIDDLLTFSRMARLEAIHDRVSMEALVQNCLSSFGASIHHYTISVSPLPDCTGDPGMLRQVWFNLLANAIKYASKNQAPVIEISASSSPLFHIYSIRDNGVGFDMKYAHKLFAVFQRLHRQDEFEGTGLGLALAKRIVSKHGGEIWAGASLHQGATFSFSIPKNMQ